MRRPSFGYIYILDKDGDERFVRLGSLDIEYVKDQYGPDARTATSVKTMVLSIFTDGWRVLGLY